MRAFHYGLCGVLAFTLAACNDPLVVDNTNNPDRDKALASISDLENFIATTYVVMHSGTLGFGNNSYGLQPQLLTQGMENVSGLANFAMGPVSALPRSQLPNSPGAQGTTEGYRDFLVEHRAARLATLALVRMRTLSLGSAARDARARAFLRLVQGAALGNLALSYDSAVIVTENNTDAAVIPLSGYKDVMAAALGYLDSAITIAQTAPAGADGFPIPNVPNLWINGTSLSAAQFIQFARSYKARFRAGVARNVADRVAVDWAQVIADANAGITADFNIKMDPTNGWDVVWVAQHYAGAEWHQMSQFFIGMADTAGLYDQFLSTSPGGRLPFVVRTPDRRFPPGDTRALQQGVTVPGNFTSVPYFQNRATAADRPGDPLQISQYDFVRSLAFSLATRIGNYPVMTRAEIRLLAAEGYLRTGNVAQAAVLIDSTRLRATKRRSAGTSGRRSSGNTGWRPPTRATGTGTSRVGAGATSRKARRCIGRFPTRSSKCVWSHFTRSVARASSVALHRATTACSKEECTDACLGAPIPPPQPGAPGREARPSRLRGVLHLHAACDGSPHPRLTSVSGAHRSGPGRRCPGHGRRTRPNRGDTRARHGFELRRSGCECHRRAGCRNQVGWRDRDDRAGVGRERIRAPVLPVSDLLRGGWLHGGGSGVHSFARAVRPRWADLGGFGRR